MSAFRFPARGQAEHRIEYTIDRALAGYTSGAKITHLRAARRFFETRLAELAQQRAPAGLRYQLHAALTLVTEEIAFRENDNQAASAKEYSRGFAI